MKKLFNWKYTIIILLLFGSIKPIPINDGSFKDTSNKSGLENISESYQNQEKNEFSRKENDSTKGGVYMEDVKKNNLNVTEIEPNKIIPTTNLSHDNDFSEDNPSSVIVDDKNAKHNSINNGLNNFKHSNNNKDNVNKNSYNGEIINTDTEENINVDNDKDINQSFDNISKEGLNNNGNSLNTEKKSYYGGPDNSNSNLNSNELDSYEDKKKAIYASGVVMGVILFFVIGNFVMRVKANCKIKIKNPISEEGSLGIDSFELGDRADDINSLYSLETMEQYSDSNQAYVIDDNNNKKNIAKIYEIKGFKDHIFTRPSDIDRNDSFNSLFRLSTAISANESYTYYQ